jgi:hypothetical protein
MQKKQVMPKAANARIVHRRMKSQFAMRIEVSNLTELKF